MTAEAPVADPMRVRDELLSLKDVIVDAMRYTCDDGHTCLDEVVDALEQIIERAKVQP